MKQINDILKKYALKPYRYEKTGKAVLIDTEQGRFVVKEKNRNNEIFKYLKSRNFDYYPEAVNEEDDYEISEYIEEVYTPKEQKALDMIDLVALLHNKTTHYKEVDEADYKKIYEEITDNINYLMSYYHDLITMIESHVFMSPGQYALARNISKIFAALTFSKNELDKWYDMVKGQRKQRFVVLHNNLEMDHFLKNDKSYLISWDKSDIGIAIFDLYKLYMKHGLELEFKEILDRYESNYPLLKEEKKLFFVLIAIPNKIEFTHNEYELTKLISQEIDFIYKTEMFISPYYEKQKIED